MVCMQADDTQRKETLQMLLADPYAAEDLVRSAAWSEFCGGLSAMLSDEEPDTAIAGAAFLDRVLEEARLCDSQSVAELFIALASYIFSSSLSRHQDAAGVLTAVTSNKSAIEPAACKAGTGLRSTAAIAVDCRAAAHRQHSKSTVQQASATSASAARCNGSSPWPEQSMHAPSVTTVQPSPLSAQQERVRMHAKGMPAQHVVPVSLEQMGEARACQIRLLVKMLEALPKLWVCLKAPMMRKLWRSLSALLLVEPVYDNQQAGHEWPEQAVCDNVDNGSVGPDSRPQAAQRDMMAPECDVQQAVLAAEPADDQKSMNGTSIQHTVQPLLRVEHKYDIQNRQPPAMQLSRIRACAWQRQACSNQPSMPAISDMHGVQPSIQSEDLKESMKGALHASLVQQSALNGCMTGARSQHECCASGASVRQTQARHECLQSISEPARMETSLTVLSDSIKAQQPVPSGCMTCATSQHGCPVTAASERVQHTMATRLQPSSAPAYDLKAFMYGSPGSYTSQQPALQHRDLNFRLTGLHGPLVELSLAQEGSASYGKSWWQAWTLPVSSTRVRPSFSHALCSGPSCVGIWRIAAQPCASCLLPILWQCIETVLSVLI